MKKLFMIIFIPVLLILGTPALIGALMYDGSGDEKMPTYLYTEDADAEKMLYKELSDSIADIEEDVEDNIIYNLHQDIINTAIFQFFSSEDMNPDYMPTDDCEEDSCKYLFSDVQEIEGFNLGIRIVGAWVDFEDDKFIANLFLEVNLDDGFTYKTIVQVHFKFRDLDDSYELEFDKIQIGSLPIPKSLISSIINTLDNQISQIDLDDQSDSVPIGELDIANMSYSLKKADILSELQDNQEGEDNTGAQLAQEVLSIVFDNNLINFTFADSEFILTAGISKFESTPVDDEGEPIEVDIPLYLYDLHYKEIYDDGDEVIGNFNPFSFDIDSYLADKFTEYVFNSALSGGGFSINERTFNKIIYHSTEGFTETRTTYEYENDLGEIEVIEIGLKAIWFEFDENEMYVYALFDIAGIDSKVKIIASEKSTSDTELVFEFTKITIGEDEGELDGTFLLINDLTVFKQMFADLGDVEFGEFDENGVLTISAERLSAMLQDGSQEGTVNVTAIAMGLNVITLTVEPADQALADAMNAFTAELNSVFDDELLLPGLQDALDFDTPGIEQDVYNDVVELQELLSGDNPAETVDPELVVGMFENFEQMETESQEAFMQTFEDLIDPAIFTTFQSYYESTTQNPPEE